MKKKGLVLPIVILVVAAFIFTACAQATPVPEPEAVEATKAPTEESSAAAEEPTAAPVEPINLEFWFEWDEVNNAEANKWAQEVIQAYEALNPNVTVAAVAIPDQEYDTKFQTALSSGTAPDGFMVRPGSWFKPYVDEGLAVSLDQYLAADGWKDSFLESAMDVCFYEGTSFCIPGGIRSVQIWYNVDVFENNGLQIPTTWEELVSVADALKEKGIIPFALANKEAWEAPLIYEYLLIRNDGYQDYMNASSRNGEGKFSDEVFVEAATSLQQMSTDGYFPEGVNGLGFGDMLGQFFNGDAAMAVFLNVMPGIASGSAPEGFRLDYFNFPSMGGDATGLVSSIGGAWAISATSKNPDQMADFLKFWTSQENMTKLSKDAGWVMPVKDTINMDDADPMLWRFYTDINDASVLIPFLNYALLPDTSAAVFESLQQILDGSIDPQTAMDKWEATAVMEYGK